MMRVMAVSFMGRTILSLQFILRLLQNGMGPTTIFVIVATNETIESDSCLAGHHIAACGAGGCVGCSIGYMDSEKVKG